MRALLVILALLSSHAAAESTAEIKARIRPLYAQMVDHDWWSAIQLEAWAAAQGVSLGPVLGSDSMVIGNVAFATPEDVVALHDFGDQVQVLTNERWHCFANDGHPLAASVPLHVLPARSGFSYHGHAIGMIQFDPEANLNWKMRIISVPSGDSLMETAGTEKSGIPTGSVVLCDDGSAAAVTFIDEAVGKSWVVLSSTQLQRIMLEDLNGVIGVGPKGTWLLATTQVANVNTPVLVINGKDRTQLQAAASGPGIGAIITADNRALVLGLDGALSPLPLPINLGTHPQMVTVGEWLVVSSGGGAKSLDDTDILGATMPDPPEQPDTLACFRWSDLQSKSPAVTASCYSSPLSIDTNQAAALLIWHEKEVKRLDLSGGKPHLTSMGTYQNRVTWVEPAQFWTIVSEGDSANVVDDQGRVLYNGVGRITVGDRGSALVATGSETAPEVSYVTLALDPKDRQVKSLQGETGNRVFDQPFNDYLLVNHSDHDHWHMLDRDGKSVGITGSATRKGSVKAPFSWIDYNHGRFFSESGRIFYKAVKERGIDDWLWPRDAYYDESYLLVLTQQGHLLKYGRGRKALEWTDLGLCLRAEMFGQHEGQPVLIDWDRLIHGTISDSATLVVEDKGKAEEMAPGPWQVHKLDFTPPNGSDCHWVDDPIGFTPRWLRSNKADSGLMAITASLVIILGHEEAGLMARRR